MANYRLMTPWDNETWITDATYSTPYARLAGRPLSNGNHLTDIGRGISLLINGSIVTESRTPSQDDLAAADQYFLGGHVYSVDQATADILIAAGYSEYLTVES